MTLAKTQINFTDLPCDIKSMIYKVNREAEKDEAYKRNYDIVAEELLDHFCWPSNGQLVCDGKSLSCWWVLDQIRITKTMKDCTGFIESSDDE